MRDFKVVLIAVAVGCHGASPELPETVGPTDRFEASAYQLRALDADGRLRQHNRTLRLSATHDGPLTHVAGAAGGASIALRTRAVGRSGALSPAGASPRAGGCVDSAVDLLGGCVRRAERAVPFGVEWWRNAPGALQHGWTLDTRPPGAGALVVLVDVVGGEVMPDERGVTLRGPGLSLGYHQLVAFDAAGSPLKARMTVLPGGLAVRVEDVGARYPITIDPLVSALGWTASGDPGFGEVLARAGDVNGDGFADFLVATVPVAGAGSVSLFLGGDGGPTTTPAVVLRAGGPLDGFGAAIGDPGDIDGDGFDDVLVGAPTTDSGPLTDAGAVYVFRGRPDGVDPAPAWVLLGGQSGETYGAAVHGGDLDQDGFADVVIGAPYHDDAGVTDAGRVAVLYGGAAGPGSGGDAFLFESTPGGRFGARVLVPGDGDGDGVDDLVVGRPQTSYDFGGAFAWRGTPGVELSGAGAFLEPPAAIESGAPMYYGSVLERTGDVTGDGLADVLIGVSRELTSWRYYESGVWVHAGAVTDPFTSRPYGPRLADLAAPPRLRLQAAGAGDMDGDGFADLLVGFPEDFNEPDLQREGSFRLYRGADPGDAGPWLDHRVSVDGHVRDGALGSAVVGAGDVDGDGFDDALIAEAGRALVHLWRGGVGVDASGTLLAASGPADGGWGDGVRTVGDVDGDGHDDLAVSAPTMDGLEPAAGAVFLVRGTPAGPAADAMMELVGGQPDEGFGTSFASAGDINGDGRPELVVGAPGHDLPGAADVGRVALFASRDGGLDPTPVWSAVGASAGERLGASVGGAGDVNGDGFADVMVGAPGHDGAAGDEGRALVWFGGPTWPAVAPDWSWEGPAGERTGASVGTAGDVDADGFADVVIGGTGWDQPPAWDRPRTEVDKGRVALFLGGPSGPGAAPVHLGTGPHTRLRVGDLVGTAGDPDGDGRTSLLISARSEPGSLYVDPTVDLIWGAWTGSTVTWTTVTSVASGLVPCEVDGAGMGASDPLRAIDGALVGDADGDDLPDLAYGVGSCTEDAALQGVVGVHTGARKRLPTWTVMHDPLVWLGEDAGARLGRAVGPAGDMTGDGHADVVFTGAAGGPWALWVHAGQGRSLGWRPGVEQRVDAAARGVELGVALSPTGDLTGDGRGDVLVGAPLLGPTGEVQLRSAAGATVAWRVAGPQASAWFGAAVAVGDLDDDGLLDAVVGAPRYGGVYTQEGRVDVFLGVPGGFSTAAAWTLSGGGPSASLGAALAVGDFDGDGVDDLAVGAPGWRAPSADMGRVQVFLGGPGGLTVAPQWTWTGPPGSRAGAVLAAGDLTGDGVSELAADAGADVAVFMGGACRFWAVPHWTLDGPSAEFGAALDAHGDLDGDGRAELVVGDTRTDAAWVYGPFLADAVPPRVALTAPRATLDFGASVSTAADLDADGYPDLAVVGREGPSSANSSVLAWFAGGPDGVAHSAVAYDVIEARSTTVGGTVVAGGDFDGDGYGDLLAGIPYDGDLMRFGGGWSDRAQPQRSRAVTPGTDAAIGSRGHSGVDGAFDVLVSPVPFAGRSRVVVEVDVAPVGEPFDVADRFVSPPTDTALGPIRVAIGGLDPARSYRWRWRTRPDARLPHVQSTTRWIVADDGRAPFARAVRPAAHPASPTAVDDAYTVAEGVVSGLDALDNDPDAPVRVSCFTPDGPERAWRALEAPAHGTVTATDVGFDYAHTGGASTQDTFTYEVCRTTWRRRCDTGRVTLDILVVDDPPVAAPDEGVVVEGGEVTLDVLRNDVDPDDPLEYAGVTVMVPPLHGVVSVSPEGLRYVHDGSESTGDALQYEVCARGQCASAEVTLAVTPVDDPPSAIDDVAVVSEGGVVRIDLLANDSDVDTPLDPARVRLTRAPGHATVLLGADGATYTHDGTEGSLDSFDYELCDAVSCVSATVGVTIEPVNDPPTVVTAPATGAEGRPIRLDAAASHDPDGSIASVTWDCEADGVPDGAGAVFEGCVYRDEGRFHASVAVVDDAGAAASATVEVNVENVAPTISSSPPTDAVAGLGPPLRYAPSAVDPGVDDVLEWSLLSGPAAMTVDPHTGELSWSPSLADAAAGTVTARLGVADGDGGVATQDLRLSVTAPDADGDGLADLAEGDGDLDGDGLADFEDADPRDGPLGDLDGDGLDNDTEGRLGTSPTDEDSDDDGVSDGDEVAAGTDPLTSDLPGPDTADSSVRPDTDLPDTDVVDTAAVDTDLFDTDVVDTDVLDTDVLDTDVLDTDHPDTDAADTDLLDTDVLDTDHPDTDAQGTDPPRSDPPTSRARCGCDSAPGASHLLAMCLLGWAVRRRASGRSPAGG